MHFLSICLLPLATGLPSCCPKEYRWSTRVKMHGYSCEVFARVDNPNMYIVTDRRYIIYKCSKSASELQSFKVLILQWMRLTFRCISLALWAQMV